MTICIAALCDNGRKVVVASDRMVTSERYMVKFEHGNHKVNNIRKNCVVVTAGDALAYQEVIETAEELLEDMKSPSIREIVAHLKMGYKCVRSEQVEEKILGVWPAMNDFECGGPINSLPDELHRSMCGDILDFDIEVDLLVCGVDEKGGHIYRITHPGTSICFDPLGHHAIGAGEPHAVTALISSGYNSTFPLKDSLFLVYSSKKIAEKAPGVGSQTDMCYIDDSGTHFLTRKQMDYLEKVFQSKLEAEASSLKQISSMIDSIPI